MTGVGPHPAELGVVDRLKPIEPQTISAMKTSCAIESGWRKTAQPTIETSAMPVPAQIA
jgi:hypothetical protein